MAVAALVGCGGSAPAIRPPATASEAPSDSADSEIPRAAYAVVPAELGDDGVVDRLRHRMLLRRWTVAMMRRDDAATKLEMRGERPADEILPVIDELPHTLRVVIESDKARYAVWVAHTDAGRTVRAPTRLRPLGAKEAATAGVWLEPGVRLELMSAERDQRRVQVVDDKLAIEGLAPSSRLGTVWVVPPGGSLASDMKRGETKSWETPTDRGPLVRIAAHSEVRGLPGRDGALLATLEDGELVGVRHAASRGGWTEIEVFRPRVRVRGFVVDAAILGPGEATGSGAIGLGRWFSMSHASRHQVGPGTCLYDGKDGEVIGVQLEPKERIGGRLVDGWAMVYVDTPWAVGQMYMKNVAPDPSADPVWDTCTQRPHR